MRGEWTEQRGSSPPGGFRRVSSAAGQFGCACLGILTLVVLSCSFVYFLFGMTMMASDAWNIVGHWLLIK